MYLLEIMVALSLLAISFGTMAHGEGALFKSLKDSRSKLSQYIDGENDLLTTIQPADCTTSTDLLEQIFQICTKSGSSITFVVK